MTLSQVVDGVTDLDSALFNPIITEVNSLRASVDQSANASIGLSPITSLANRAFAPSIVAASPPTVTLGAMNGSPTVSDPLVYDQDHTAFRYFGTTPTTSSIWYQYGTHTQYWAVDFETDADVIEISSQASTLSANIFRLIVDGEFVAADPAAGTSGAGGNYYINVDFGSSKPRHVVMEMENNCVFGGVYVTEHYTVWRSSTPTGPRVSVIGDSIVEGATTYGITAWPVEAGKILGWRDVNTNAVGGTGYLKPNPSANTFRERISTTTASRVWADGTTGTPQIVIVAGGTNDAGVYTAAAIGAEAELLFGEIKTALPDAILIVHSEYRQNGNPNQTILDLRDALEAAATAAGADLFVDQIVATTTGINTQGWITGTGKSGSTVGNGNADRYVNTDGTHPTLAGQRYLGRRSASAYATGFA